MQQTIEEIKSRLGPLPGFLEANGVDINRGKFRCFIPGHADANPSANIFAEGTRWYCFVCNRGGDIIDAAAIFANQSLAAFLRGQDAAKYTDKSRKESKATLGRIKWQ